jgi:hypothetical protein
VGLDCCGADQYDGRNEGAYSGSCRDCGDDVCSSCAGFYGPDADYDHEGGMIDRSIYICGGCLENRKANAMATKNENDKASELATRVMRHTLKAVVRAARKLLAGEQPEADDRIAFEMWVASVEQTAETIEINR